MTSILLAINNYTVQGQPLITELSKVREQKKDVSDASSSGKL